MSGSVLSIENVDTEIQNFCVVPMSKGDWSACVKHAGIVSNFLRLVGLDKYRFHMAQTYVLQKIHQGKTTLEIEMEKGRHSDKCVLKVCTPGESCWPYVISHDHLEPEEIYKLLYQAMGEKTKVHLKQ